MHLPKSSKFWITSFSTVCCVLLLSYSAWPEAASDGASVNVATGSAGTTGAKGSTGAASLIKNSSFEYPAVEAGSYRCVTPGWGWTGGDGSVNAIVHPGDANSEEPWASKTPAGMDGSNFCQLFAYADQGAGVLYQDTGIKYQKGAAYTLSAAFGLQTTGKLARNCTMFVANSSLVPMAYTTIEPANLSAGTFTAQNISYMATGNEDPGDGTYGTPGDIFVGFWLPASPAGSYLDFDNVRLSAPSQDSGSLIAPSPTAAGAAAAVPPPSQAERAKDVFPRWSVAGEWHVTHPEWTNVITLRADGSITSPDPNLAGKWILSANSGTPMLVFHWDLFGTESLAMVTPDHFRGQIRQGIFMDMQRGDAPQKPVAEAKSFDGAWRVTHPWWTGVITLRADGSIAGSDPAKNGKWILTADGGTPMLVFQWDLFSTESLTMVTPDHFRGQISEGVFMDIQRVDAPQKSGNDFASAE